jgi:hypothetical protein
VSPAPFNGGDNCHCHEIEDNDAKKRCSELKLQFSRDLDRDYGPAEIARGVTAEFLASAANIGERFIKRKDVVYASNSHHRAIPPHESIKADLEAAIKYLHTKREDYQCSRLTCGMLFTCAPGLYNCILQFILPLMIYFPGLAALQGSGTLILMDSTHKYNKWNWRLFTLTVRDKFGSWIPAAQFLVEHEDSVSVAAALQALPGLPE